MKCLNCDKSFESKRKDQQYCSSNCRLKAFRNKESVSNETNDSKPPETDNEPLRNDTTKSEKCLTCQKPLNVEVQCYDCWKEKPF